MIHCIHYNDVCKILVAIYYFKAASALPHYYIITNRWSGKVFTFTAGSCLDRIRFFTRPFYVNTGCTQSSVCACVRWWACVGARRFVWMCVRACAGSGVGRSVRRSVGTFIAHWRGGNGSNYWYRGFVIAFYLKVT